MMCKIHIKIFDAENIFFVNNAPSNPYLKFWFKGKLESAVRSKIIYNTVTPKWDQDLYIISKDYNSDILLVSMYTQDTDTDFLIMDIIEIPLRLHKIGEHYVFKDEIKIQNSSAGILHFVLDFLLYPEIPLNKEISNEPMIQDLNEERNNFSEIKRENEELMKEVINKNEKETNELKAQISKLTKENQNLKEKINDKSTLSEKNYIIEKENETFYEDGKKIGEGNTSIAFKITDKRTGKSLCKKILKIDRDKTTETSIANAVEEFKKVYSLNHPCICKAIGINTSEIVRSHHNKKINEIALFSEYCPNSLKSCIEKNIFDNTLKAKIVIEIAHAMLYIHNHDLIHCNLRVDNILLNSIFESKITNLGLVQIHNLLSNDFSSFRNDTESIEYMPPEIINDQKCYYKADVYSFGIVVYFIFCGKLPKIEYDTKNEKKNITLKESSSLSSFCLKLISKCLSSKPEERPDFKQIINDIETNSFNLAPDVDTEILSRRDEELKSFD